MLHGTILLAGLLALTVLAHGADDEPLGLHPENPHYFLFRGEPTILLTSAEHYGAVLNLDFDYVKYLDALQRDGMNNTRTFVGSYVEPDSAFNITRNSLAPAEGRFICPWARSDEPGYANGGNKFDLSRWDEAYFARLTDFVAQAGSRGIIVEVNLFCPFYGDAQWAISPMNAANNINGIGKVARTEAYRTDGEAALLKAQEDMTRRVVAELRDFDNIYYEIMNEPYIGHIPLEWQGHIAQVIVDAERQFANKHLISQNVANVKAKVDAAHEAVSVFNFHYAWPPITVAMNYGLNRPIGDNETGFKGTADDHYRLEGWAFILAGGALYNHLDYSFTVGHEDGSFAFPKTQPGGGGAELRRQLRILGEFIRGFDFISMSPAPGVVKTTPAKGVMAHCLAEEGRQYAMHLCRPDGRIEAAPVQVRVDLPKGEYLAEWVDTLSGKVSAREEFAHVGGTHELTSPPIALDAALRIVAK